MLKKAKPPRTEKPGGGIFNTILLAYIIDCLFLFLSHTGREKKEIKWLWSTWETPPPPLSVPPSSKPPPCSTTPLPLLVPFLSHTYFQLFLFTSSFLSSLFIQIPIQSFLFFNFFDFGRGMQSNFGILFIQFIVNL